MFTKIYKRILKKIISEDSLPSAAVIVSITYFISALLGLFRNRILATYFGDSVELGIFYMADKLPGLIYSLLIATTVSSAFIPIFLQHRKKSKEQANIFMSNLLNVSMVSYLLIALIVFIFSDFFCRLISWNSLDQPSIKIMSRLIKYILLSQIFLIVSTYYSTFLQSYKRFIIPAIIPILYNFGIILGTALFHDKFGINAPAIGMLLGSLLGVLFQLPFIIFMGFRHSFKLSIRDPGLKKALVIIFPKALGISVHRLYSLIIGGFIALVYSPSYLVIYEFANQLQTMPVNAFGTSLSQAMLPTLSDYAADNEINKVASLLKKYTLKITYFTLSITMMFFVLRIPITRLLFGGDKFSWLGTNLTAYTLAFFSISIWFQTLTVIFSKVFYSFGNSKTPTRTGVISLIISFLISALFANILKMGVWSFALAFSIGAIINTLMLYVSLSNLIGHFLKDIISDLAKISFATLLCGEVTYILLKSLDKIVFDTTRTVPLFMLTTTVVIIGLGVFITASEYMGISYFRNIAHRFKLKFLSNLSNTPI